MLSQYDIRNKKATMPYVKYLTESSLSSAAEVLRTVNVSSVVDCQLECDSTPMCDLIEIDSSIGACKMFPISAAMVPPSSAANHTIYLKP